MRYGSKGAADALAKEYGQQCRVNLQLHRLEELFPWRTGGIYGAMTMDYLHVVNLGIIPKFARSLDALFIRCFERTPDFKSYEDVHQRIEEALQAVPAFSDGAHRLKHFTFGWWAGRSGISAGADRRAGQIFLGGHREKILLLDERRLASRVSRRR